MQRTDSSEPELKPIRQRIHKNHSRSTLNAIDNFGLLATPTLAVVKSDMSSLEQSIHSPPLELLILLLLLLNHIPVPLL